MTMEWCGLVVEGREINRRRKRKRRELVEGSSCGSPNLDSTPSRWTFISS